MIAIVAPAGIELVQNLMMTLQATISKGTRAASKMKKLYPAANPNASSTHRPAKRMNGDEIGRYVTISDMQFVTIMMTEHHKVKARNNEAGESVAEHSHKQRGHTRSAIQKTSADIHIQSSTYVLEIRHYICVITIFGTTYL